MFNLKMLKGKNVVVHCNSETKAKKFINWVNSLSDKNIKVDYHIYKKDTCYRLTNELNCGFNDLRGYKKGGYKILSYEEAKV